MATRNERKRKAKARLALSQENRIKGFIAIQKAGVVAANKAAIKSGTLESKAATVDKTGGLVMPEYGYSGVNILSPIRLKSSTHSLRGKSNDKTLTAK